jgi:transcriptional regulator with XRE-family HTH domain
VSRIDGESAVWHVDHVAIDCARGLRGWTRGELARRAGVDAGTVSDMFRRRRRPVLGTVQAISTALRLGLENVIVFENEAA